MNHVPTEESRRQVKAAAGFGLSADAICTIVGILIDDLDQHYAKEQVLGRAEAEAKVRQTLYQQAIGGSIQAAKAWLEQNAGWYS